MTAIAMETTDRIEQQGDRIIWLLIAVTQLRVAPCELNDLLGLIFV